MANKDKMPNHIGLMKASKYTPKKCESTLEEKKLMSKNNNIKLIIARLKGQQVQLWALKKIWWIQPDYPLIQNIKQKDIKLKQSINHLEVDPLGSKHIIQGNLIPLWL